MSKATKELINNFLSDPDLEKAKLWNTTINMLDICKINELNISNILSWLLNPNESHGLGDNFIRNLLRESILVFNDAKEDEKNYNFGFYKNTVKNNKSLQTILKYDFVENNYFNDSAIIREFEVKIRSSKKGKIDILIISHSNELVIVLEIKIGSLPKSNEDQYIKYIKKEFNNYDCLFLFLDYYENFKNVGDNWLCLKYDWIAEFCKNNYLSSNLSTKTKNVLREYYTYLTDEYDLYSNYNKTKDLLPVLASRHKDLIDKIKENNYSKESIAFIYSKRKEEKELIQLEYKYHNIIDVLSDFSEFDAIKQYIQKKVSEIQEDDFEIERNYICFKNSSWEKFQKDPKDSEEWPIYPIYYRNPRTGQQNIYISIWQRWASENIIEKLQRFAEDNEVEKLKPKNETEILKKIRDKKKPYTNKEIADLLVDYYKKIKRYFN